MTKECSEYTGEAGSFCTIAVLEPREGSRVARGLTMTRRLGIPTGLLDSNVVLDAGNGNRAVGRCTLDLTTFLGLCTFWDGTGRLTGFHARADVSCPGDGIVCDLDGTYSLRSGVE